MKAIRSLAAVVAVVVLVPAAAQAQAARPFQNSWFWGIKGGGTLLSAPSQNNVTSAMAGIDWLITRTHGGLYVSFDQSFLSQYAVLADSVQSTDTPSRVNLKNMRRLSALLMGYPGSSDRIHPYVGLGMVYSMVGSVTPTSAYGSSDQSSLAQSIIQQYKSVFAPAAMLGVQVEYRNVGLFVQGMGWSANQNFFLYNSRGFNA
ncbi:MAG TPA: hypothetical protein VIJ16_05010, partial [Gemmatimonadaceae bacterium]